MAKSKVLRSVAHNIGRSFLSSTNYAAGDYVLSHILRHVRSTCIAEFSLDLLSGVVSPPVFFPPRIAEVPGNCSRHFLDLVQRAGSDRSLVLRADLALRFDLETKCPYDGQWFLENFYKCTVTIVDTHGREYVAAFKDRWHTKRLLPEPH